MNTVLRRPISSVLIAAMAWAPFPAMASDKINCESERGRYNFCRADTDGKVKLIREFSNNQCREGRTWGYENRGVWVDRGCAAEFRVGRDKDSDKKAAIAVGVVGLAVIAAMAANANNKAQQENQSSPPREVQRWNAGEFSAFDSRQKAMVKLTVQADGRLSTYSRGEVQSGSLQDNAMFIGSSRFRIEPQADGFLATDQSDTSRQLRFERQGGGR